MDEKYFTCLICDKEYSSYMGLWKHKKIKHNQKEEIIKPIEKPIEINNKTCQYCNKEFSDRSNRWRHEKTICKLKNTTNINNIKEINNSTIGKMSNDNSTFNDNSTNIQNLNITINKLGCEDISILSQDDIEEIINNGLSCAIKLIELINFNNEHPQNHSFCTTNLNNKYTSVLNIETNEIEKKLKIDVFDKVLFYALNHIDILKDRITDKKKRKLFAEQIKDLEDKMYGKDKGYKKIFIDKINEMSYNNKNMIKHTWDNYLKNILVMNL